MNEQQIAEFLQNIQIQADQGVNQSNLHNLAVANIAGVNQLNRPSDTTTGSTNPVPRPNHVGQDTVATQSWMDEARETTNRMIVEAEQMKAKLDAPQGIPQAFYSAYVDDEFFHITCHIDPNLHTKIEQGGYVELEKLLVKDRPFMKPGGVENRMGLFTKDGVTYFAPTLQRDTKISNVKRWEQAFHVYASIYSKANPTRASEIWQYVHIINSAATSYQWSNVAEYNFTFRQLMAAYPKRL